MNETIAENNSQSTTAFEQNHIDDDDDDKEQNNNDQSRLLSVIMSYLQETMNIEKLAQRYENMIIIYNETNNIMKSSSYQNEEYNIKSKIDDIIRNDSPTLILNNILPLIFPPDNNIIMPITAPSNNISSGNTIDNESIFDNITKVQSNIMLATEIDNNRVLKMNHKVSAIHHHFTSNDAVVADPTKTSLEDEPLYELSSLDSSTIHTNKRLKKTTTYSSLIFYNDEQKQRTIALKTRRLYELYHASKCTHDYINHCSRICCPESKHCGEMKRLWYHMEHCCHDNPCQYPHCQSSQNVLNHYKKCVYKQCPVCSSFRLQLAATIAIETNAGTFLERKHSLSSNTILSSTTTASTITSSSRQQQQHHYPCYFNNRYIEDTYAPIPITMTGIFEVDKVISTQHPLSHIKENNTDGTNVL